MQRLFYDNDTHSLLQKCPVRGLSIEQSRSRFTQKLGHDEWSNMTFIPDVEGNEIARRRLAENIERFYAVELFASNVTTLCNELSHEHFFSIYELTQTIALQQASVDLITIADVEILYFKVISQFAEVPEVQSIYALKQREELHFLILLSTEETDKGILFPLFGKEALLHDQFPEHFFTFHYFPAGLPYRRDYIATGSELIYQTEDAR